MRHAGLRSALPCPAVVQCQKRETERIFSRKFEKRNCLLDGFIAKKYSVTWMYFNLFEESITRNLEKNMIAK